MKAPHRQVYVYHILIALLLILLLQGGITLVGQATDNDRSRFLRAEQTSQELYLLQGVSDKIGGPNPKTWGGEL